MLEGEVKCLAEALEELGYGTGDFAILQAREIIAKLYEKGYAIVSDETLWGDDA